MPSGESVTSSIRHVIRAAVAGLAAFASGAAAAQDAKDWPNKTVKIMGNLMAWRECTHLLR